MKLPAFALFERSLRLESRSLLMGWTRVLLLALILFWLFPTQTMARSGYFAAPGLNYLQEMAWVNLVFISLAGLSYFAAAITEEKEEMMLGLLRMTDLNPISILLGKSTSRLVGALLLLLVQVPFILLAVTLGGVGLHQIIAIYSTLLAYLFFVSNLALLFSVLFRTTAIAASFTLAVLLVFLIGPPMGAGIKMGISYSDPARLHEGLWPVLAPLIDYSGGFNPPMRLVEIFRTGFAGPAVGFQVASNLILGVLLFIAAWLVFDWCTREEKDASPVRFLLLRRAKSRRSLIPSRLAGAQVVTWKDFTFISGGRLGLLVKFGIIALLVAICNIVAIYSNTRPTAEMEGDILMWVSLIVTAVCLALEASHIFQEETRWKTLSALITLPISVRELAYRKVLGALAGTLPLLAGLVLGVLMAPRDIGELVYDIFTKGEAFGVTSLIVLQFILFLHLTVFLSLVVKRGALPLAIAIQYLGGSFLTGFMSIIFMRAGGELVFFFMVSVLCVVLSAVLHGAIGLRLAQLAAEE